MDRPKVVQLDAIFATVDEIRRAEAHLRLLKQQVAREALALAKITDKRLRIEAGFYAYWFAPEVNATDIAFGASGKPHPGKLLKLAGAVSLGIPCDRCQEDLPICSRTQMKETLAFLRDDHRWPEGYRVLCTGCQNAIHEERRLEREANDRICGARQRELAAMPYTEYLQTGDWEEARDRHLWYLAHETHTLECEICNAESGLGVYHKTIDGLGGRDDLTLLCIGCRDALVAAGKLAGDPGELNLMPPELARCVLDAERAELGY